MRKTPRQIHLTSYAAASPCENFGETFHFYLRHNDHLPVRLNHESEIARKWESIDRMAGKF